MKYGMLSAVVLIVAPLVALAAFLIHANAPEGEGSPFIAVVLAAIVIAVFFGFHWLVFNLRVWLTKKLTRALKLSQIRKAAARRAAARADAHAELRDTQSRQPGDDQ